ncbi:Calcineurin subunit B [Malassezia equina]|uniref:Calcineurin subunit B n=1 Tax=Malassezia equina TaxID=1381935 RepID=A0AAF0IYH4_9BASI|nr:Calcineurin subunit B [Malassezia equina]
MIWSKTRIRLKKRFLKLDRDGSGSLDRDEFLQVPAIANNPLAQRLISIFDAEFVFITDASGGGTVDFQEFVHGLSVFTSLGSREEKLQYQQLQQIVDKTIMEADKNGDGKIDFYEFLDMVNNTDDLF